MLTMKQYLALIAISAASACHAQALPAGQAPSNLRQVNVQKPQAAPAVMPRQLSAQERAELRRQLYQFSRTAGKGS